MCAQIGKQTHIDTICGTFKLKLWPPHIETTCVPKQENRHTLVLFVAHLTSNCDRHTQRQHVCHTQKNRVYMWPHIQYWYYMSVTICGHIQYHFWLIIYLIKFVHIFDISRHCFCFEGSPYSRLTDLTLFPLLN